MDNFEWSFGIIYIDFETKGRIWKYSEKWYADVIADRKAKHTDSAEA
ncbi:family 1 glycosylhydrolase [Exiguobacterium sp. TRN 1102]